MTQLFSRDELDALARPPRTQLRLAVEEADALAGDPTTEPGEREAARDRAVALLERLERSFAGFVDGFGAFQASIQEWVFDHHGNAGLSRATRLDRFWVGVARSGWSEQDVVETSRTHGAELGAVLDAGGPDVVDHAMELWGQVELAWRRAHDLHRDAVGALLSHVYREYGVDALESCLRLCGERTLLAWMPRDIVRPPEVRLRQWAGMMLGNFASIRIEESDDAFTITQDPCGTCTRQLRDGAYDPPVDLAVVHEAHPVTWGRGDVPIYRTHVAVMHGMMPMERIGTVWPEIHCPEGRGTGPCTIVLHKQPMPPSC